MDQKSLFLQFWRHEAVATRKVISRIPQEMSDYRPHPRSRTAREIAWLFVVEERLLVEGLERGVIDWRERTSVSTARVAKRLPDSTTTATLLRRHARKRVRQGVLKRTRTLIPLRWLLGETALQDLVERCRQLRSHRAH